MKVGVLYSGGKDSNFCLFEAKRKGHEICCLIYLNTENNASYMFQQTPREIILKQSKSLNIPVIEVNTKGEKELELKELESAILQAKNQYKIEGVVSGAVKSNYQADRIEKICDNFKLDSITPIWHINEIEYLNKLIENNFKIMIVKIAGYPLTEKYLGKILTDEIIEEFIQLNKKYKSSPVGEGGEFETICLNSPEFDHEIDLKIEKTIMEGENLGYIVFFE